MTARCLKSSPELCQLPETKNCKQSDNYLAFRCDYSWNSNWAEDSDVGACRSGVLWGWHANAIRIPMHTTSHRIQQPGGNEFHCQWGEYFEWFSWAGGNWNNEKQHSLFLCESLPRSLKPPLKIAQRKIKSFMSTALPFALEQFGVWLLKV